MATRFIQEATQQLTPSYNIQQQAIQSQIPAVQKLYDSLVQGLEGQRQVETQSILESANARGVLRSSLPVDLQTELGKALLAQRGQIESQRAGDIAGINTQLGTLGIQKSQNIADLARGLETQDLARQQLALEAQKIKAASAANNSSAIKALVNKIGGAAGLQGDITIEDILEYVQEIQGLSQNNIPRFKPAAPAKLNLNAAKSSGGLKVF